MRMEKAAKKQALECGSYYESQSYRRLLDTFLAEHLKIILKFIAVDVNRTDTTGRTPLYVAAKNGHVRLVVELIALGADLNLADQGIGKTPLFVAAEAGHDKVVAVLTAAGADVNLADKVMGMTPLRAAAAAGHAGVVAALIAAGADVNLADKLVGKTPLLAAIGKKSFNVAMKLIAAGADVNLADKEGRTPLSAATAAGHAGIVAALKGAGAKASSADKEWWWMVPTPLLAAIEKKNFNVVMKLIAAGADVNLASNTGETPLLAAIEKKGFSVVMKLIAAGADVNLADKAGTTPLIAAVEKQDFNVVMALIAAGADVNLVNDWGHSPLLVAVWAKRTKIVELLLGAGVDVGASVTTRALSEAVEQNNTDCINLLTEAGVAGNDSGHCVVTAAKEAAEDQVTFLNTVITEAKKTAGVRLLHRAVEMGCTRVVIGLLDAGVDPNAANPAEATFSLLEAAKMGHTEIVAALLRKGVKVLPSTDSRATKLAEQEAFLLQEIAKTDEIVAVAQKIVSTIAKYQAGVSWLGYKAAVERNRDAYSVYYELIARGKIGHVAHRAMGAWVISKAETLADLGQAMPYLSDQMISYSLSSALKTYYTSCYHPCFALSAPHLFSARKPDGGKARIVGKVLGAIETGKMEAVMAASFKAQVTALEEPILGRLFDVFKKEYGDFLEKGNPFKDSEAKEQVSRGVPEADGHWIASKKDGHWIWKLSKKGRHRTASKNDKIRIEMTLMGKSKKSGEVESLGFLSEEAHSRGSAASAGVEESKGTDEPVAAGVGYS